MSKPLVSAVICVYNGEEFLVEAIESVLAQDYSPVELVVVDDGSEDGTAGIATGYQQVKLVRHEKNQGIPKARNSGIRAAAGEYIAFLDADDVWVKHKVRAQLDFHQRYPDMKFSYTYERFMFANESDAPSWTQKAAFQEDHAAYCVGSMMFERSIFDKVGVFNPEFVGGSETAEWIFRAKDMGYEGGLVEEVLLLRRIHENNLSSNVGSLNRNLFRSVKASIERQKKAGQNE